jgi:hypothetical protein
VKQIAGFVHLNSNPDNIIRFTKSSSSMMNNQLEYVNWVWNPFNDVRVDRVERVHRWSIWYALRGLGWTDMHDLRTCTVWGQMRRSASWHLFKKAIDCLCDVYFRCSEWVSDIIKLVVRSRLDHTAISDSRYRVSAYWFPSNELWNSWMSSLVCLISVWPGISFWIV